MLLENTLTNWSATKLDHYNECPYRVYLKYIKRVPEPPPNPKYEVKRQRGILFHDNLRDCINDGAPVPRELMDFEEIIDGYRALGAVAERVDHTATQELEARQHGEGLGLQGVADQDGRGLVPLLVDGGLAAAQVVIVHRRQVVVDQRIAVDELHRRRHPHRAVAGDAEQAGAGHDQEGTQPLAAAQACVAHRLEQLGLGGVGHRQEMVDFLLDQFCRFAHGGGEFVRHYSIRAGSAPIEPSAATVIRSTFAWASRSLASQWRRRAVPRS